MRDIDRLFLYEDGFPVGSTRRKVYQNCIRKAKRLNRLPAEAVEVMKEVRKELRTFIWETLQCCGVGGLSRSPFPHPKQNSVGLTMRQDIRITSQVSDVEARIPVSQRPQKKNRKQDPTSYAWQDAPCHKGPHDT